jgi:excisionase family DNA binding protein
MTTTEERPMRIKEAAKFLGVSRVTLYKFIEKGMPVHQKNGCFMFLYASEINNWIKK